MFLKIRNLFCLVLSIIASTGSTKLDAALDPRAAVAADVLPPGKLECSICLEVKDESAFVTFECTHSICGQCTKNRAFTNQCPICRTPVKAATCGICKQNLRTADKVMLEPCRHMFHSWHINPIIYRDGAQTRCPVCQRPVTLKNSDGSNMLPVVTPSPTPLSPNRTNITSPPPGENSPDSSNDPKRDTADTSNTPQSWAKTKNSGTPAFLAQEIATACAVGALARAAWLKFGSKEKNAFKRTACAAAISVGILGTQILLSYTNPDRFNRPDLALTSWLLGVTGGVFITDLIEKYKKKPETKKLKSHQYSATN